MIVVFRFMGIGVVLCGFLFFEFVFFFVVLVSLVRWFVGCDVFIFWGEGIC